MNEIQFLQKNIKKWEAFESLLNQTDKQSPDQVSDLFIQLTDDLAYSRSYFPETSTTDYLNELTRKAHRYLYQSPPTKKSRLSEFWGYEFPLLVYKERKTMLVSFAIFCISALIGIISEQYDNGFSRIILGDSYINMTLSNISDGDPLAVYKQANQVNMFLGITLNNIRVAFFAFAMGLLTPVGVGFILLKNGVMLGTFQSFLAGKGFLLESVATIWIHGTLEIFAIIIAGGAGLIIGNSILFPGSFSRIEAFKRGARKGAMIVLGLVPVFIVAGFLEGFITRYTHAPYVVRFLIILLSLAGILLYFYFYPKHLIKKQSYDKQNH